MSHGQAPKLGGAEVCKAAGSKSMAVVAMVEALVVVVRAMVVLEWVVVAVVLILDTKASGEGNWVGDRGRGTRWHVRAMNEIGGYRAKHTDEDMAFRGEETNKCRTILRWYDGMMEEAKRKLVRDLR